MLRSLESTVFQRGLKVIVELVQISLRCSWSYIKEVDGRLGFMHGLQ